ncbi:hypothetical protein K435DRAFT_130020 [Dendrothele bispora CBS 962.96]|uniref:AhpC-TSA-domain-containing protein n=1 Tax=Dendrothele bispora (strain CBS 962.96) TaxID=1314807 RepID=A0A4S8M008_DENBC|nr:hypothetical protein K435DRAFT_130020 [Dendrothele bispora CBS 962.96]
MAHVPKRKSTQDLFRSSPLTLSSHFIPTSRPESRDSALSTSSLVRQPLLFKSKSKATEATEATDIPFHEHTIPTYSQLQHAASQYVISQTGQAVPFGTLFKDRKTVVCFIRHFLCPLCQDYMFSISRNVSPAILREKDVDLVIISNGSYGMIKSYRKIFRTPFAVYTDPAHVVYNALGMTLQTTDGGPYKPEYVRHNTLTGTCMVVANAVKARMPLWKSGGKISQLGGEFILGPGLQCSFAHRMRYTRSHMPILEVIKHAGVDMYTPLTEITASEQEVGQTEFNGVTGTTGPSFLGIALRISMEEERRWMQDCRRSLAAMHARKRARRGGKKWVPPLETTSENTHRTGNGDESANQTPVPSPTYSEFTLSIVSCSSTATTREYSGCSTPTSCSSTPTSSCSTPTPRPFSCSGSSDSSSSLTSRGCSSSGASCTTYCDSRPGNCFIPTLDEDDSSVDEFEDASEFDVWNEVQIEVDPPTDVSTAGDDGLSAKVYPFLLPDIPSLPSLSTESFQTTFEEFADVPENVSELQSEASEAPSLSEFSETHSLSEFPSPPKIPHLELRIDTEHLSWGDSLKIGELRRLNGSRIIDLPLFFSSSSFDES